MDTNRLSRELYDGAQANPSVLYIGQSIEDGDLREIVNFPWSCVVTTRHDLELSASFQNDRRFPVNYWKKSEVLGRPFDRKKLPVLRLMSAPDEEGKKINSAFFGVDDPYDNAKEMLRSLVACLSPATRIHITGMLSDTDREVVRFFVRELTRSEHENRPTFWGMPQNTDMLSGKAAGYFKELENLADQQGYLYHRESLADVIRAHDKRWDTSEDQTVDEGGTDTDIYYQAGRPIRISQQDKVLFKNFGARLLTDQTFSRQRPNGTAEYNRWFLNFLDIPAFAEPIWCGYEKRSKFYVKRSFEDPLVYVVRRMLEGRQITDGDRRGGNNNAVMLTGDPGSSKSVTLGALAYRIFNEKLNPVIYIYSDSFLGLKSDVDQLDKAIQFLENHDESNMRALVIWDISTFRDGMETARGVVKQLTDRGRRFLLVCSGYTSPSGEDAKGFSYREGGNSAATGLTPCRLNDAAVLVSGSWCFVKALRDITPDEQNEFFALMRLYSGIENATIQRLQKKIVEEGITDIFYCYYYLIYMLRERLEVGLKREHDIVTDYVKKTFAEELKSIRDKSIEDRKLRSPMYQIFVDLGYTPPPGLFDEVSAGDVNFGKRLDRFNLCAAMFTRFKLKMSYFLGCSLLMEDKDPQEDENSFTRSSTNIDYKLFSRITTQIPWLICDSRDGGDLSFRFRTPLEAGIYLKNNDPDGAKQQELLISLLEIYGRDYRTTGMIDPVFCSNLQSLLHMIGPNSKYPGFSRVGSEESQQQKSILNKLDIIIDKLIELVDVYRVPDGNAEFASIIITFTREFYNNEWEKRVDEEKHKNPDGANPYETVETYELRIQKLAGSLDRATNSIETIESSIVREPDYYAKRALIAQKNILTTELVQCNTQIQRLMDDYCDFCTLSGKGPNYEKMPRTLNYQAVSLYMRSVISSNPTNGYSYNTLFNAFELEYQKRKSQEEQIRCLELIYPILDQYDLYKSEIRNRGARDSDELGVHISRIRDYSGSIDITLEHILRYRRKEISHEEELNNPFFQLYDMHLNSGSAASIEFLCRKELQAISNADRVMMHHLPICRKIHDFMREKDNYRCVSSSRTAMELLIRVTWMLYNESFLSATEELQLTRMTIDQWRELHEYCEQYSKISGEFRQPVFILLYALATVQINGFSSEDSYKKAIDILGSLDEEMFKNQARLRTPFMLCDENGMPHKFNSGIVLSVEDEVSGYIWVDGVPKYLGRKTGVRFHKKNLGKRRQLATNDQLKDLELGIGYLSFSVYTEDGRKEKQNGRK